MRNPAYNLVGSRQTPWLYTAISALVFVSHDLFHFIILSMPHWLIELALMYRMHQRYVAAGQTVLKPRLMSSLVFAGVSIAATIFFLLVVSQRDLIYYWSESASLLPKTLTLSPAKSLILTFSLAFIYSQSLLHFFFSACIYRFRNPEARAIVLPLLIDSPTQDIKQKKAA